MMRLRITIMCKAPVPGAVKTRLISEEIDSIRAAALHKAMATTVIERACAMFADASIAADDRQHPFFSAFGLPVRSQGEGDLGVRMQRQVQAAFSDGCDAIMLLGTDSPHMPETRLREAASALKTHDLVIGPVEDGGYDLIAMRKPYQLFSGVRWSSADTMADTIANAVQLKLKVCLLAEGFDIDDAHDLKRAQQCGWNIRI